MSFWILTKNRTVQSRTTVQKITNLEKETNEMKVAITEFDCGINKRFKEEDNLGYDGAKPNVEDWSEYLQHAPDFQEEFENIVNDPVSYTHLRAHET